METNLGQMIALSFYTSPPLLFVHYLYSLYPLIFLHLHVLSHFSLIHQTASDWEFEKEGRLVRKFKKGTLEGRGDEEEEERKNKK